MSKPAPRKETDDKFNLNVFAAASKLISKYCPWIWFGIGQERIKEFTRQIHNNNRYIKAMGLAVYCYNINNIKKTKNNLCQLHVDAQNGQGEALLQVFIISKMIWEKNIYLVGE